MDKCKWYELTMFGYSREEYECGCVGNRFEVRKAVPHICPFCGKETETIEADNQTN